MRFTAVLFLSCIACICLSSMQRIPIAALGTAPDAVPGLPAPKWGFFGHRRLNRLAIFTLPSGLVSFYKKHIEYVTEHAVDPDKRRYASTFEASRHFLDLDRMCIFARLLETRCWSLAMNK